MYKGIVQLVIGLMMLVTLLVGYLPIPEYLVELTSISNMLGGVLLTIDGILSICGKKNLSSNLYRAVCVCILTVFFICLGSLTGFYHFNFKGAFFFLHVINPIAFVGCYLLFCNDAERRIVSVANFITPVLMLVYLLFDYIRCQFTGKFVYGFAEPDVLTFPYAVLIGIAVYIIMMLFSVCLLKVNKVLHR